jgi:hypothetical protein
MAEGSGKKQTISPGSDCDAVVQYGETTVELNADGVIVKTKGNVIVYTNGDVKVRPAANDDRKSTGEPKPGDKMPDGTVYAGISPDTGKAMYATAADAPLTYTFNHAQKYAANLDANGHKDWRVPTKAELNVLFKNRAAIGGFNETGSYPAGWYWSSSQDGYGLAWGQRFSDGSQLNHSQEFGDSSLRCVR